MQVTVKMGTNEDFFNCFSVSPDGVESKFASIPIDAGEAVLSFMIAPFKYKKIVVKKGNEVYKTIERG